MHVNGATSTSNYIQVPSQQNLRRHYLLGWIGQYLYVVMKTSPGKTFVMHFDYVLNDRNTVRISASNIYKTKKNLNNGRSLQIPLSKAVKPDRWTFFQFDALQLLTEQKMF